LKKDTIEDYTILSLLGRGAYGSVLIVQNNTNKLTYTMRTLNKRDMSVVDNRLLIKGNRPVLELIDFPLIARLDIVFQSRHKLYLLGKYEQIEDISSFMTKKAKDVDISKREQIAKLIAAQLIVTLDALHTKGLIYRQ
jgi:serine/threonine protein kinase